MNEHKHNSTEIVIEQISADQLDRIIDNDLYILIDVRDPESIATQGNIPGAINIPFDILEGAIDQSHQNFNFAFNGEGPFLFCCTGGVMSYMAAIKAQNIGIRNVCNLEGGHAAWIKSKETLAEF